jgi:hypothetical protein
MFCIACPNLLPPVIAEIEKTDETFENDEGPIDLPAMQDQFEAKRFQGRSLAHKKIREGGGDEKEKFFPNFLFVARVMGSLCNVLRGIISFPFGNMTTDD